MNWPWLYDPLMCVELVTRLAGASVAVSGAEWLVARRLFAEDAVLGWSLLRARSRVPGDGRIARGLGGLLGARGWTFLQWLTLVAGLVLLLAPAYPLLRGGALFVATVVGCLTHVRQHQVGVVGGDRMRLCVVGALALGAIAPGSVRVAQAVLWFVAGQSVLAYWVAGLLKCPTPEWRRGTAIGLVLRQSLMGHARMANWLLQHPGANCAATWGVLGLELLFPLALAGGVPVAGIFVLGAGLMHLGIGQFMGLAPFLWAFLATYPAILFASGQIHGWAVR